MFFHLYCTHNKGWGRKREPTRQGLNKFTMSRYVVNNGKYQCNECNTAVGTRGGILKHWKVKHNPTFTPWNCKHCQRTFTSKYKFRKHDCTGKSYSTKDAVATFIQAIIEQEVEAPTIIMQQDTEAIVQPEVEATTIIQQDNEAIIQQEVEAPIPIRTQQDTEAIVQQEVEATTIIHAIVQQEGLGAPLNAFCGFLVHF